MLLPIYASLERTFFSLGGKGHSAQSNVADRSMQKAWTINHKAISFTCEWFMSWSEWCLKLAWKLQYSNTPFWWQRWSVYCRKQILFDGHWERNVWQAFTSIGKALSGEAMQTIDTQNVRGENASNYEKCDARKQWHKFGEFAENSVIFNGLCNI